MRIRSGILYFAIVVIAIVILLVIAFWRLQNAISQPSYVSRAITVQLNDNATVEQINNIYAAAGEINIPEVFQPGKIQYYQFQNHSKKILSMESVLVSLNQEEIVERCARLTLEDYKKNDPYLMDHNFDLYCYFKSNISIGELRNLFQRYPSLGWSGYLTQPKELYFGVPRGEEEAYVEKLKAYPGVMTAFRTRVAGL